MGKYKDLAYEYQEAIDGYAKKLKKRRDMSSSPADWAVKNLELIRYVNGIKFADKSILDCTGEENVTMEK